MVDSRLKAAMEERYCGAGQDVAGSLICHPGSARWYALRVAPQREDQAEAWLRMRGVYAFHPVLPRKVKRFGKVCEYQRRYLPGYVFARFPGEPVVHAVTASPFITGAITMADGRWGKLDPSGLRAIHAMRRVDEAAEAARRADRARQRRASAVRAGDSAMFRSGPFAAFCCEVVELRADGGARVRLNLFGREVVAQAAPRDLVRLAKGG